MDKPQPISMELLDIKVEISPSKMSPQLKVVLRRLQILHPAWVLVNPSMASRHRRMEAKIRLDKLQRNKLETLLNSKLNPNLLEVVSNS